MHDSSQKSQPRRGRPFLNGNAGRPAGSRNRVTRVADALLTDEAETLVRKAIELARRGDVGMLKFLLGRILPRERAVKIDIPNLESADDVVAATAAIMREVADGHVTPTEGAALAAIVKMNRDAIDLVDVVRRLDQLEEQRGR